MVNYVTAIVLGLDTFFCVHMGHVYTWCPSTSAWTLAQNGAVFTGYLVLEHSARSRILAWVLEKKSAQRESYSGIVLGHKVL